MAVIRPQKKIIKPAAQLGKALALPKGDLSNFSADEDETRKALICLIYGPEKSGKSFLALTAPGDIAYLTNDRAYQGPVKYFRSLGKKIYVSKYFFTPPRRSEAGKNVQGIIQEAAPLMDRWEADFIDAHHARDVRTIIVDNGSLLSLLCLSALHGKTGKILPRDRGKSNERMQRLYSLSQDFDKNVIWIHRQKEIWKGQDATGEFTFDGFKWAGNEVQVVIETSRKKKTQDFKATITDCSWDAGVIGEEFDEERFRFPHIAGQVLKVDEEEFSDGVEV